MTNPMTVSLDDVRGLIEERERYEGWLEALESRREATPPHVFDRVRTDYDARLRGVSERLAQGVIPLRDAEGQLARRQDEVVQTLGERQDELAELELRTLVGEFSPEDGERRIQEAASVVRELDGQRRNVTDELDGLRALLARAEARRTPPAGSPVTPETPETAAPSEPAAPPPPTPAAAAEAIPAPAAAPVAPGAPQAPRAAYTTPSQPTQATQPWARPGRTTNPDDEAFVGTGERLDSLAAALGGTVKQTPIAAAACGQEKSVRFQDCGEMNYPTEWYCERCGGELAAL
jgi:hypothetical protein